MVMTERPRDRYEALVKGAHAYSGVRPRPAARARAAAEKGMLRTPLGFSRGPTINLADSPSRADEERCHLCGF